MVRLREIPRTATFAWSPGTGSPYLATGTRAGAVDADFSNDTQLELWDLSLNSTKQSHELQPAASIDTDSRFHDIAWVQENEDFPKGVIAGALENGSLDLWNAEKLLNRQGDPFMSRTSKHSGAIKSLQFNPFRPELLATAGAKGELYISDLNNIHNPFRMGNSVARADDFECLDWNKNVPHIMVTGSSGGFVTVWDVKTKKESLTLNNLGRKAVSAVAWDPDKHTRLITAIPHDTDPLILIWDLRNSNAPERVLRGHDGGVLSLSWCPQDNDLLLSCGKDNRTICWNPQSGESYGEFPVVTNWTFQTRWNPHNPNLLATASFDGKIGVHSIQNTNPDAHQASGIQAQTVDDEDFFNKAQSQPQGASFTLKKAPRWLERPCGVSFGFGGKVLSFCAAGNSVSPRTSTLRISTFAIDAGVGTSVSSFESALKKNDLKSICESKIADATLDAEKADWKVIETLTSKNPRKILVDYLGFSSVTDEAADGLATLASNGENKEEGTPPSASTATKSNRLSAFFDSNADGDSFLSDLAATKGAKTNNPFQIYSGSESESDRRITHALLLGQFETALDVCLQENRLSDAFMVAICGGQACIDKVQKAYFNRKAEGPNYLRLLASVVGKNLWDVVYNAELIGWKEVMAIICTYARADEFPDLCEALGDRLDEQMKTDGKDPTLQKNASFCYLAGSKLEKVVTIWIAELDKHEEAGLRASSNESSFSVHARSLQSFIEKVTVFREVTHFQDGDRKATSGWKLMALYDKYAEYADIIASHGQLHTAEKYLELLPDKYPAAEVARNRIKEAIRKPIAPTATRQAADSTRSAQRIPSNIATFQNQQNPAKPNVSGQPNPYAPSSPGNPQNPRMQSNNGPYSSATYNGSTPYQQPHQLRQQPPQQPGVAPPTAYGATYQSQNLGPPSRNLNASPSIAPPSKAQNMSNWNDTPESFFKPPTSRRGTPGVGTSSITSSAAYPGIVQSNAGSTYAVQPKSTPPLAPPPKGPIGPPPRMNSPSTNTPQSYQPPERPPSSAATAYAPQQPFSNLGSVQQQPPVHRGPSPYNVPPTAPPPSNRYAPAPSARSAVSPSQQEPSTTPGSNRQGPLAPNPYAPQQSYAPQPQNPSIQSSTPSTIPLSTGPPPRSGPPSAPPHGPPQGSRPGTAQSQRGKTATPVTTKHPPGDRSHIPTVARPIFEILSSDMQRVKARAPQSFKPQVNDTEKRLNILFDHLNNEELLKEQTVQEMVQLAQALQARKYEEAQMIHVDIMTNRTEECGNWMVGVKRLIGMSRATP